MKQIWMPLVEMIKAITEMVTWQTKRYKKFAKMEDKILPLVDRILDIYPLAEPVVDRAITLLEKNMPKIMELIDSKEAELQDGISDALQSLVSGEPSLQDKLNEANIELDKANRELEELKEELEELKAK